MPSQTLREIIKGHIDTGSFLETVEPLIFPVIFSLILTPLYPETDFVILKTIKATPNSWIISGSSFVFFLFYYFIKVEWSWLWGTVKAKFPWVLSCILGISLIVVIFTPRPKPLPVLRVFDVKIGVSDQSADLVRNNRAKIEEIINKKFKSQNIQIKLDIECISYEKAHGLFLQKSESIGDGYDIVMLDDPWIKEFYSKKMIEDLNSFDFIKQIKQNETRMVFGEIFDKSFESYVTFSKDTSTPELVGLPFLGNVQMLITNSSPSGLAKFGKDFFPDYIKKEDNDNDLVEIFFGFYFLEGGSYEILGDGTVQLKRNFAQNALKKIFSKKIIRMEFNEIQNVLNESANKDKKPKFKSFLGWPSWIAGINKDEIKSKIRLIPLSEPVLSGFWILSLPKYSRGRSLIEKNISANVLWNMCIDADIQTLLAENYFIIASKVVDLSYLKNKSAFWENNFHAIQDSYSHSRPRPSIVEWQQFENEFGKVIRRGKLEDINGFVKFID